MLHSRAGLRLTRALMWRQPDNYWKRWNLCLLSLLLIWFADAQARVIAYYNFEDADQGFAPPCLLTGIYRTCSEPSDILPFPCPFGQVRAPKDLLYPPASFSGRALSGSTGGGFYDAGNVLLDVDSSGVSSFRGTRSVAPPVLGYLSTQLTISLWFYLEIAPADGEQQYLIEKQGNFFLRLYGPSTVQGRVGDISFSRAITSVNVSVGEWHNIVLAYREDSFLRLYLDGNQHFELLFGFSTYTPGYSSFVIGNAALSQTTSFNGWIDEVVIHNSVLNLEEVYGMYQDSFNIAIPTLDISSGINFTSNAEGYLTFKAHVDDLVHFEVAGPLDASVDYYWQNVTITSCGQITAPVENVNPSASQISLHTLDTGTVRVDLCVRGSIGGAVNADITYGNFAMLDVLPTAPIIKGDLPSTATFFQGGQVVLFFDVLMAPQGVVLWQYFLTEEDMAMRVGSRWYDGGIQMIQRGSNGTNSSLNGTWIPFQVQPGGVLTVNGTIEGINASFSNVTIIRAMASNMVGTVISNEVTVTMVASSSVDTSSGRGGDNTPVIPIALSSAMAAILLCLSCCCLLCCFLLLGIVCVAGIVSTAGLATARHSLAQDSSMFFEEESRNIWHIPFDELELGRSLGSGAFGTVNIGTWRGTSVAVKQLQLADGQVDAFLAEADVMKELRPHPNVVQLYGVCTDPESPMCIVMEYLAVGDLLQWLRKTGVPERQLAARMAYDIAAGMSHLAQERIVHRDLAARNLLLTDTLRVKVADFGMSQLHAADDDTKEKVVGPIRWMAPEVLQREEPFSEKSDVYSFGVTLYEIYSGGSLPYPKLSAVEAAIAACKRGLRPSIPPGTPSEMADLMQACWAAKSKSRPTFREAAKRLKHGGHVSASASSTTGLGAVYGAMVNDECASSRSCVGGNTESLYGSMILDAVEGASSGYVPLNVEDEYLLDVSRLEGASYSGSESV